MRKEKILFLIFLSFLCGCSLAGPQELDRLIKEDPAFRQMIVVRDQAHNEMHQIKEDLLAKKKILDAQIDKLRSDYDLIAKAQNKKIEQLQTTIETNRNLLKHEMETAAARLSTKGTELTGYQKTLADVKKVLHESKGIHFSSQEKQKWEERILMLSEKMRPLTDEIQELKLEIRLKKQKMNFLK